MRRGFAAVSAAKEEADANRGPRFDERPNDFKIVGEGTATVWFNGTADEPLVVVAHEVKLMSKRGKPYFAKHMCGQMDPDHAGCVFCYSRAQGNDAISPAKDLAVFNVVDLRWVHKVAQKTDGQYPRYDWSDCDGDIDEEEPARNACLSCRKNIPRERRGPARYLMSLSWAQQIQSVNEQLGKKCRSCGKGKIRHEGFSDAKGRVVPSLEDVKDPSLWEAQYTCTKCEDPQPGSIFHCPMAVTKSGVQKTTSYNFSPGVFEEAPLWVQEITPYDLEKICAPFPAGVQAKILGVENPFAADVRARQTEEYAPAPRRLPKREEDDEEEEAPRAAAKSLRAPLPARPALAPAKPAVNGRKVVQAAAHLDYDPFPQDEE